MTEFLIFKDPSDESQIDKVRCEKGTVWLTQKLMAELFSAARSIITKHSADTFSEGELKKDSVCAKFAHTAKDGKSCKTMFYSAL